MKRCGNSTWKKEETAPRYNIVRLLWRPLTLFLLLRLSTATSLNPSYKGETSVKHGKIRPLFSSAATRASITPSTAEQIFVWATSVFPVPSRKQKQIFGSFTAEAAEYQSRKKEWAKRYTNVDSLRETFGSNRNKLWGDLDAGTSRRLYKTLMPVALLELARLGVQPEDLAPLAYQARVTAKLYARERSQVPARVAANLFDGFRQLKRYGSFNTRGMTYEQVWDKYHKVIMDDQENDNNSDDLTEQDVTAKICLKILERSCVSNKNVDRLVLRAGDEDQREDLSRITKTLEMDVRKLLDPFCDEEPQKNLSLREYRTLRLVSRVLRRAKFSQVKKKNGGGRPSILENTVR